MISMTAVCEDEVGMMMTMTMMMMMMMMGRITVNRSLDTQLRFSFFSIVSVNCFAFVFSCVCSVLNLIANVLSLLSVLLR